MKPVRYVVKSGDTLWSIAGAHYGDPVRWGDLYAYNNRPDIVALTDRPIVNPDRMIPGQAIFLPPTQSRPSPRRAPSAQATDPLRPVGSAGLPNPGGTATAPSSNRGLPRLGTTAGNPGKGWGGPGARTGAQLVSDGLARNAAVETLVNDFAHAFHLDGETIDIRGGTFSAVLHLHGVISLQRTTQVPLVSYSSRTAELQARSQSAMLLGLLLSTQTTQLGLDPQGGRVAFDSTLTRNASMTSPAATLVKGVTERGQPVLKGKMAFPDFTGRISNHVYLVHDLSIDVELTTGQSVGSLPRSAPRDRKPNDRADWTWAAAVLTPNVMIVGAVVDEDAVTAGGGLADAATTVAGSVAGTRGGRSMIRFASAAPTPVQIGGR